MRLLALAIGCSMLAGIVGCGEKLPSTVKLGGNVTIDGVALTEGTIVFYPADKEGASPTAAPIIDGKYSAPAVVKGQYRVAFRPTGQSGTGPVGQVDSNFNAPKAGDGKAEDIIPKRYAIPSLPADAMQDNMALNFDLKKG